ncbi:hypothetical protein BSL82_03150 [Tardibacter chloracetimidivorans]|uniref:Hydrolase n=1 Tax=Tardibacter chloracetimidivorans TaxID=1921510 RepID=A0A1L3ZS35_9SPHN|nr:HAD family hydrolase [Tardibacter chloracetimidivorans]API58420.1 hypothetical protein BSL82_03150 [Tardibacter chloracetimidivorans]
MTAPVASVVVLDLDDTLYLERDYVRSGFKSVEQWLALERAAAGFSDTCWRLFEGGHRGDIFDQGLLELGLDSRAELVAQLVTVYREHHPDIALQPDARRFLEASRPGQAIALLTDGHLVSQQRKIEALGIAAYGVNPLVITGLWGRDYWKPHRRGFETIMAEYGLPPSAFTYVGDNPAKDFTAPSAMGWRTVQITRPGGVHNAVGPGVPDLVISSLDELPTEWPCGPMEDTTQRTAAGAP